MPHLVYRTTNLINGMIYIGSHGGCLDDGYLGSGTLLRASIEKYGKAAFKREVLFIFDRRSEMLAKEAELVTEEFLDRNDVLNTNCGGGSGRGPNSGKLQALRHRRRMGLPQYRELFRIQVLRQIEVRSVFSAEIPRNLLHKRSTSTPCH